MKKKSHYLIIYDITENKKRTKLAKTLNGYGYRIQKSAFEAKLSEQQFAKLLKELKWYDSSEDSIRIYEIPDVGDITRLGKEETCCFSEVIIV